MRVCEFLSLPHTHEEEGEGSFVFAFVMISSFWSNGLGTVVVGKANILPSEEISFISYAYRAAL